MNKIIFGILAIAIGILGTLAVVYRADVGEWFEKTFKPAEINEVEDPEEDPEEDVVLTPNGMTITVNRG